MSRLQSLEMSMLASPWERSKAVAGGQQAAELDRKVMAVHPALSYKVMRNAIVVRGYCEPRVIFFSFKMFSDEYRVRDGEVLVGFEGEMALIERTFLVG